MPSLTREQRLQQRQTVRFEKTKVRLALARGQHQARVLSVRQPFAELIASGVKRIELRSRKTNHRGPLLIVAGGKPWRGIKPEPGWVFGCSICVVDLIECRPATAADAEAAAVVGILEVPAEGWWSLLLSNPRRVEQVPHIGRLGLYAPDLELAQILAAVGVGP